MFWYEALSTTIEFNVYSRIRNRYGQSNWLLWDGFSFVMSAIWFPQKERFIFFSEKKRKGKRKETKKKGKKARYLHVIFAFSLKQEVTRSNSGTFWMPLNASSITWKGKIANNKRSCFSHFCYSYLYLSFFKSVFLQMTTYLKSIYITVSLNAKP